MKKRSLIMGLLMLLSISSSLAQETITQTIRGRLLDAESEYPLIGATVVVVGSDPAIGTVTDANGEYRLENVPIGRVDLQFSYIGYKEARMPNVLVTSGKEVLVNMRLQESVTETEAVTVVSKADEPNTLAEMATVSTRSFNVEETGRYAGSRNDPSRMAQNFAGVSGANDGRNDIIIRGNSPTGLLWRLNGVDIPSPNHFASLGTTGGPVSMLNNNLLDNSGFMTGAFPAGYGNAVSGVFDLQMRRGNSRKHEFLGQIGFNGFEAGAEGPLGNNGASYLVNYRYSFLAFFDAVGLDIGTGSAVPYYQDLSFHLDFPAKKAGRFSLFGVGGRSNIDLLGSDKESADSTDLFGNDDTDIRTQSQVGVIGLSHVIFLDEKTFIETNLAASGLHNVNDTDTLYRNEDFELLDTEPQAYQEMTQLKYKLNTKLNRKFNARNKLTVGGIFDLYDLSLEEQYYLGGDVNLANHQGTTTLFQGYAAWQHRFSDRLTLNAGMHYVHFGLNGANSVEPRLGLAWQAHPRHRLSLAYGRHSQLQGLQIYFIQTVNPTDGSVSQTNKNLELTKADHLVLGYDWNLASSWRIKAEAYYQRIFDVPVERNPSYFSMLNAGADFGLPSRDNLVSEGTGFNIGMELTVEKFFTNNWYALTTISLYDSKYEGSDGIERNTAFNGNFVFNGLFGREFPIGKRSAITVDLKFTYAGNRRFVPFDVAASSDAGFGILNEQLAFDSRLSDYSRGDINIGYRINGKKISQEFAIDIQNVANNRNVFSQTWDVRRQRVRETTQLGMVPIVEYRILF